AWVAVQLSYVLSFDPDCKPRHAGAPIAVRRGVFSVVGGDDQVWVTTPDGVARIDGTTFAVQEVPGLGAASAVVDEAAGLWLSCRAEGAACFVRVSPEVQPGEGVPGIRVWNPGGGGLASVGRDRNGGLWGEVPSLSGIGSFDPATGEVSSIPAL